MEIQEETTGLFDQDKKYVLDYLKSRKVTNRELSKVIKKHPFGLLKDTSFLVGEEEYGISHFLSKSDVTGYDIQKVNTVLGTDALGIIAFAVVVGDDVLCYDIKNKKVFLWMVQTQGGDQLPVSDNLTKFLKALN